MATELKLSVHQLVDFLLRSGDIDTRVFNSASMIEGSNIHSQYQSRQNDAYMAEYPLKTFEVIDEINIVIEGRADGIIKVDSKHFVIEEIKSCVIDLDTFHEQNEEWHLGQAKVYGYMFCKEQSLESIDIRLTYIKQGEKREKMIKEYTFMYTELQQFFFSLLEDYIQFYTVILNIKKRRNDSLEKVSFPFKGFRNGQKELSKYSYAIAKNGGKLFVEAPTGIGKTISTIFPFVKSLPFDDETKIFYLTAKTSGKESAHNTLKIMREKGAHISSIVITAKEKICFCKDGACNPDECPYAKGYYSKVGAIIKYCILNYEDFDYDNIVKIANEYGICPFEFELDLSLFMDVIICDYNYMFDPVSYMKRFFDEDSSHFLALIDEAHNLVDRSRDMYSATFSEYDLDLAKKSYRYSSFKKAKNQLAKFTKRFNELKKEINDGDTIFDNLDPDLFKIMNRFVDVYSDIAKLYSKEITKEFTEFYLLINRYLRITEIENDSHLTYIHKEKNELSINLLCLDASKYLVNICNRIKGSIFFSATLSPINYYIDTLGGDKHLEPVLMLQSPFPIDNLKVLVAPKVSVKYKNRDFSYNAVADYIKAFISAKIGNYFIYVPSYEYLDKLMKYISIDNVDIYVQSRDMTEQERLSFVEHFQNNPLRSTLGFAILGGAFSEGIDLVSDRLIGAVIVGIGMPKINFVSDQIAEFYDSINLVGNDYAYVYPGMNKVMQAVGRVIRDENDKGAVLLIDERYTTSQYRNLFKKEWDNYEIVLSPEEVEDNLYKFFC